MVVQALSGCWITVLDHADRNVQLGKGPAFDPVVLCNLTTDYGLDGGSLSPANLLFSQGVPQSCTCQAGPDDILFKATPLVQPAHSWHLQHANNVLPGMRRAQTLSAPGTQPGMAASSLGRVPWAQAEDRLVGGGPAGGSGAVQVLVAML
ncbi:hypothetical protein WJX72_009550 [[Myrmecia] bisecta]|uniref:Uncharacterized protein n=1 Tax=[Myrmecia] bisecta TaxID=41462 RepID=A0AAW1Q655_9CHLO